MTGGGVGSGREMAVTVGVTVEVGGDLPAGPRQAPKRRVGWPVAFSEVTLSELILRLCWSLFWSIIFASLFRF